MPFKFYIENATYLSSANLYILDIQLLEGKIEFDVDALAGTDGGEVLIRVKTSALGMPIERIMQNKYSITIDKPDVPIESLVGAYAHG